MTTTQSTSLDDIATSDGTFAVVAMDQRSTLKRMYAAVGIDDPAQSELVDIKADVVEALAPVASAFLLDPTYGIPALEQDDPVVRRGAGVLVVQYSRNQPATAARLVTAALQADPDLVGVFATNLFAAEGTATGIRQAGNQDQVKVKVKVIGFDAGPDQLAALEEGTIQALIAQMPGDIGVQGVQQAVAALGGDETTPEIETGFTIITKDHVDGEGGDAAYKSSC